MTKTLSNPSDRLCFVRSGVPGDVLAWERVTQLAQRTGASIQVIACIEEPAHGLQALLASMGANVKAATGEDEIAADVERLVQSARAAGIEARGTVTVGATFGVVVQAVLHGECDLVVKAAQPSTLLHSVLYGHLDRQLVRHCPCPVWIEKSTMRRTRERILAAVDPTPFTAGIPEDLDREVLNETILRWAVALADTFDADLEVVHVWPFHLEVALQSRVGLTPEAVAEVGETIRSDHERALQSLLRPVAGRVGKLHVLKGNAGEQIARLTKEASIDMLVLGTVCRKGVTGFLIGNTAETVLDQVECSLLTLKPSDFVMPPSV
jgi:nucleotide-binding universal stress UspA family protein